MAPAKAAKIANSWSMWTSTVTEPVTMPTIHICALVLYIALMIAYSVVAIIDFANHERPVLFESQETNSFGAVPLNVSIDCKDCRRFLEKFPDGRLWSLSWDYTTLPGGCAARSPELFSDELRAFCAKQNSPPTTREYYMVHLAGCPAVNNFILPWSLSPFIPFGTKSTREECQALCDETPTCHGFSYAPGSFSFDLGGGNVFSAPKGMCQLHDPRVVAACPYRAYEPRDPSEQPGDHYFLKETYNVSTAPSDALDRCTLTSDDWDMLEQSASPDPAMTAADAAIPFRAGYGWNANYIGTRPTSWDCYGTACPDYPTVTTHTSEGDWDYRGVRIFEPPWLFGPSTPSRGKGSFFKLKHSVPLCHAPGSTTPLTMQVAAMPHHSFANGGKNIGEAVVTLSSGDTFEQVNAFQPWHKNTIHLGLTVNKDERGTVTAADPYFSNFQYDGRVDWGVEEGLLMSSTAYYRQMVKIILGDKYDGITLREALAIDSGFFSGAWTKEEAMNFSAAQWAGVQATASKPNNSFLDMFQQEFEWRSMTVTGGRRLEDKEAANAAATLAQFQKDTAVYASMFKHRSEEGQQVADGQQRRRLSAHDEWGGVQLSVVLGRFANVYQLGHKPGFQDILAAIGGASGSLIGLIGIALATFEVGSRMLGSRTIVKKTEMLEGAPTVATLSSNGAQA